ncbi:MAG: hypothetical protein DHS20C14_16410 [Phycisphaeraceae bacterium]|nr:MAG: hypothetical protein DHS20C14_16410 [Phycisphaeraceae bacterium]
MSLVYCGIDEAGFGPMLGPLCVSMAAVRVHEWTPGEGAPDLWKLLHPEVCRCAKDARGGRIAVADSKALKGSNSLKTRHPLRHLERGVLGFAGAMGWEVGHDEALFEAVGARMESCDWQGGGPVGLPLDWSAGERAITVNVLSRALARAGVEVLDLRCRAMGVEEFNGLIERAGSKAATTEAGLSEHLAHIRDRWSADSDIRIVCDRQSGRLDYTDLVRNAWGAGVEELERSARVSRYRIGERVGIQFVPEAEDAHMPVALASMLAKLVRELAMMRFNRYWAQRLPELKPTAGYVQDARRWLEDAAGVVSPEERRAMIRIA